MKVTSLVRGWALLPQHISPTVYSYGRLCISGASKLSEVCTWRSYLVEFRGSAPSFRFAELNDAAISAVGPAWSATDVIDYTAVVSDTQSAVPVCCYVKFPNDAVAQAVAQRCSLVRRILQVWGDGTTPLEALADAEKHFEERVDPVITAGTGKGTWRMKFERFGKEGRSGMTDQERRDLLTQLAPIGLKFKGRVDLKSPEHHLVYLEDWHTYHDELHALIAQIKTQRLQAVTGGLDSSHSTHADSPDVVALRKLKYKPLRCIIGRVVGEGPAVVTRYDLRNRPFIGTTSMNPLSAYLSANAARVTAGQRVLDPFCGTGSLLVAAASLGADVVGSDIDGAGLLGSQVIPSAASSEIISALPEVVLHSKNARFTRKGGNDQLGLCVMDNFAFYNLTERVVDMIGVSVDKWLLPDDRGCDTALNSEWEQDQYLKISKYDKFDAIITDPPFGKRERAENDQAVSATTATAAALPSLRTFECLGDPSAVLVTLFRVALQRLKPEGMLVFWLPTRAFTTTAEVTAYIESIQQAALAQQRQHCGATSNSVCTADAASHTDGLLHRDGVQQDGSKLPADVLVSAELRLLRVTAEKLNDNLWRWLCVMQHK